MIRSSFVSALALAAAGVLPAAPAAAEHAASSTGARPDPVDAEASVPPLAYRSAFSDYRPLSDGKVGWKEANDEVGRIGGWRSYARQAHAPGTPASAAAPAAPAGTKGEEATAPMDHGGHGGHGAHGTDRKN